MSDSIIDPNALPPDTGGAIPPGWTKLATYGSANQAELFAAVLAAEGLHAQVFGANTNMVDWFWQMFNDVHLIVPESEVAQAKEILSKTSDTAVEPAEEPTSAGPPKDEDGNLLITVAAFENIQDLRDVQLVLASENIDAFAPRVVLRGDRPAGKGKRFVLRVAEKDLEEAKSLLSEEAADDQAEPRCPKCRSWSVISRKGILGSLAEVIGMNSDGEFECTHCHYRGPAAEFLTRSADE